MLYLYEVTSGCIIFIMENSNYEVDAIAGGFDILERDRHMPRTNDYDVAPDVLFRDVREQPTITMRVFDEEEHRKEQQQKQQLMRKDMEFTEIDHNPIDDRKSKTIEILADEQISVGNRYNDSDTEVSKRKTHRKRPFIKPNLKKSQKAFPGQLQTQRRLNQSRYQTKANMEKEKNVLPEQERTPRRRGPAVDAQTQTQTQTPKLKNTTLHPREQIFFEEKELDRKIRLNVANMEAQEHQYRQELRRVLLTAISQNVLAASEEGTRLSSDREQERRLETLNVLLSPHVTTMISDLFTGNNKKQTKEPQGNYEVFRH